MMLFYNLVNRRPKSRVEPIRVWTSDLCWLDIWLHLLNLWLQHHCFVSPTLVSHWSLDVSFLGLSCSSSNLSFKAASSLLISISLSSLLIGIKAKSTRRCFGAISNILLTHVKVQIHTKDLTYTLCKDKQDPPK